MEGFYTSHSRKLVGRHGGIRTPESIIERYMKTSMICIIGLGHVMGSKVVLILCSRLYYCPLQHIILVKKVKINLFYSRVRISIAYRSRSARFLSEFVKREILLLHKYTNRAFEKFEDLRLPHI